MDIKNVVPKDIEITLVLSMREVTHLLDVLENCKIEFNEGKPSPDARAFVEEFVRTMGKLEEDLKEGR